MLKTEVLIARIVKIKCLMLVVSSFLFFIIISAVMLNINNDNYKDVLIIFGNGLDMVLINTILIISILLLYKLVISIFDIVKLYRMVVAYTHNNDTVLGIKIIHKINIGHRYLKKFINEGL